MKVAMVGTPMCPKCKRIQPKVEEYCVANNVVFNYYILGVTAPKDIVDILVEKGIRQAPVFLLYKDDGDIVVLSGDEIFVELESLK